MKYLIGIYQDKEKIDTHLDSLQIRRREIMEVGPFSSWLKALRWMEYMEEKLQPHPTERYSLGTLVPNTWYGATFVADGSSERMD